MTGHMTEFVARRICTYFVYTDLTNFYLIMKIIQIVKYVNYKTKLLLIIQVKSFQHSHMQSLYVHILDLTVLVSCEKT
jgi:hypothetical protein